MARVFLHIGAHKTGTTYLQNLFHLNRQRLERAGVFYPDIGPNTAHHALARAWIDLPDIPDTFYGTAGVDGLWDQLIEQYAGAEGTLLLSAENFSRARPQVINWADLARRLAPFEEVRIVYTMRTQVELVQALWLQLAKTSRVIDLGNCVRTALQERRVVGVGVDHYAVYGTLRRSFAAEQVHLLDYEQIRRGPGGVGQAFLDLLGCDLRADDLEQPPQDEANISPEPLSYWVATQVAGKTVPGPQLLALVSEVIGSAGRPTTLLSRDEYSRLQQRYAQGNAYLVDTVQPVQPGFSFLKPEPPEDLLYRDDISQSMWIRIASGLNREPSPAVSAKRSDLLSQIRTRLTRK